MKETANGQGEWSYTPSARRQFSEFLQGKEESFDLDSLFVRGAELQEKNGSVQNHPRVSDALFENPIPPVPVIQ